MLCRSNSMVEVWGIKKLVFLRGMGSVVGAGAGVSWSRGWRGSRGGKAGGFVLACYAKKFVLCP